MPQKLDKDNSIAAKSETPFDDLLNIIRAERPLEISKDEFVGVDVRNPLFNLMRWYFKSKNAICPNTGMGIRTNMGKKYELHWDHIFPYEILKSHGYNRDNRLKYALALEITNRVILATEATRSVDETSASSYLQRVRNQYPNALKKQSIPENEWLWSIENFEAFLEERRVLLANELNAFLNNITATIDTEVETSIEDLITSGESSNLEFKSSLSWSYNESRRDTKMEEVILKSIAAFNNSEGGTLLIGVSDDGIALGLEPDYQLFKKDGKENRDVFELHLRNLINRNFGVAFAATSIEISFPTIGDRDICRIDVKRGRSPILFDFTDKNGNKIKRLYVRSGNSSPELSLTEIAPYIQTRFATTS